MSQLRIVPENRRKKRQTMPFLKPRDGLLIAFFVPVLVMICIFVQRGIFPFGERCFLRTDMYHQYAPFFSEFQYKLRTGGSLLYSWDVGMGVNFAGAVCLLPGQPVKLADSALPEEVYHRIYDDHDCSEDRTFGAELCLVFKETQPELYPGGWVLRDLLCPVRIHGGVQLEHHVAGLHSSVPTDRIRP